MDQPGLCEVAHRRALAGLTRINRLSGSAAILWPELRRLAIERLHSGIAVPLRVLDIATGAGDVIIHLANRARRADLPIEFSGADKSEFAVDHARRRADRLRADVDFFTLDALADELPGGYDVLTCSLFLHHLDEREVVDFLDKMRRAARRAVLVNDLIRSPTGYLLVLVGTRLLSRSPIVHNDGKLSIHGAFSMAEALGLARSAGWQNSQISWRWPYRFLLTETRS